jgi:hypothetical protein
MANTETVGLRFRELDAFFAANSTFAGAGTFNTTLNINAPDGGGSPAMTAIINMHGYEGRGVGIKMRDNVTSASSASDREWFVGTGYNQSGFNIGYATDGSASSYAAQAKLLISTSGDATFAGTVRIDGSNLGIGGAAANASHGSIGTKLDMKGGADSIIILRGAAGGTSPNTYVASEYGLYSYNGEFSLTRTNVSSWWTTPDFKLNGGNAFFGGTVYIPSKLEHTGDADTFLSFSDDTITLSAGGNSTTLAGSGSVTFPGAGTFGGNVTHTGLTMSAGTDVDQLYSPTGMTFTLAANTWTDTGINGNEMPTGVYAMCVYVSDFNSGGEHYYETYAATISWYGDDTNSTVTDEIAVHRSGHAPNNGDVQFRTARHASGGDKLMLQVKHNKAYSAALDNSDGGKIMRFKFRRLI